MLAGRGAHRIIGRPVGVRGGAVRRSSFVQLRVKRPKADAAGIDREGKTPEEAAKAWVEANPEKVDAFLARALA